MATKRVFPRSGCASWIGEEPQTSKAEVCATRCQPPNFMASAPTTRGCLGNSNDQDGGVVLKLDAAEIGDAVQQATVKRLRRQLTVAARGLGRALFAKLLAACVHRLAQAIRKHHQAVSGPQVDLALIVNTLLESTHDQAALLQAYLNTVSLQPTVGTRPGGSISRGDSAPL